MEGAAASSDGEVLVSVLGVKVGSQAAATATAAAAAAAAVVVVAAATWLLLGASNSQRRQKSALQKPTPALRHQQQVGATVGTITDLFIYPVKSCGGCRVSSARVTETGLEFDRRFMLTTRNALGQLEMVSQRQYPLMALVRPRVEVDSRDGQIAALHLHFVGSDPPKPLAIDVRMYREEAEATNDGGDLAGRREEVVVWPTDRREENAQRAVVLEGVATAWFQKALGTDAPLELVFMDAACRREVSSKFSARTGAGQQCRNSFSDVTHYLAISKESLEELNNRVTIEAALPAKRNKRSRNNASGPRGGHVPMNRFRPNFVVAGTAGAHAEDTWAEVEVVSRASSVRTASSPKPLVLFGVKNCTRCVIPTTDQVRYPACSVLASSGPPFLVLQFHCE